MATLIDLAPHNPHGLSIASPLIAAAGSLGFGVEYARLLGLQSTDPGHGLGALITRSLSLQPQRARPLPQIVAAPAGLIYRGAEHNPGLRSLQRRYVPIWATWQLAVIVAIFGDDPNEVATLASELDGLEGVRGIELSLALNAAFTAAATERLVRLVRAATTLPLLVKLPGEAHDLAALAQAAVTAGADALALIDGFPGEASRPDGAIVAGRLSGPAIFPLALQLLRHVRAVVSVPLIGMGGVATAAHVQAMQAAGADAVAIGAALLADPRRAARIAAQI